MRIVTHATDGKGSLVAESELQFAMQVLRAAYIPVAGGGIVGHGANGRAYSFSGTKPIPSKRW